MSRYAARLEKLAGNPLIQRDTRKKELVPAAGGSAETTVLAVYSPPASQHPAAFWMPGGLLSASRQGAEPAEPVHRAGARPVLTADIAVVAKRIELAEQERIVEFLAIRLVP